MLWARNWLALSGQMRTVPRHHHIGLVASVAFYRKFWLWLGMTSTCCSVFLGWLVVLLTALVSFANPPEGPVFINDRQLTIPIRCNHPESVARFDVYVSPDQGKQWQLYASVPGNQQEVMFVAGGDGIYWFDLITHYQDGRVEPTGPGTRPPLLVVYVDTKPPRITLRAGVSQPGEAAVSWEIQEEYLDLRTFRLEYRDPQSGNWTPLPVIPPTAHGEKRWPVPSGGKVLVRLTVADLAENSSQSQVEVMALPAANPGMVSPPYVTPSPALGSTQPVTQAANVVSGPQQVLPPPPPPVPLPSTPWSQGAIAEAVSKPGTPAASTAPWPPNNANSSVQPVASSAPVRPTGPTAGPSSATFPQYATNLSPHGVPPSPLPAETVSPRVIARSESSGLPATAASWNQGQASSGPGHALQPRGGLPAVRYLNSSKANLHYEVSGVGPSGLGSVELWMTRDDGRTWFKAADDPDLQPPMLVEFPGEGVYGLTLVVRSRVGLGRAAPQPGEPPQLRIEVDTTPPYAELYAVEADPQRRDTLILQWSATDKNLAANPITLKWAERESGPWHDIATDLPNTGRYIWKMPENLPYMVYLRLEVRDLAGNLAVAQTPKPVLVDLQEPEVKVLDILPSQPNR